MTTIPRMPQGTAGKTSTPSMLYSGTSSPRMQRSSFLPEVHEDYNSRHATPPPVSGAPLDPASERPFGLQRAGPGVPVPSGGRVCAAVLVHWACPDETSKGWVGAWAGLLPGSVWGSPNGALRGPSSLWTAVAGGLAVSCTAQSRGRHHHGHGCESALPRRVAGHLVARECCAHRGRLVSCGSRAGLGASVARARWAGEGLAVG